MRYCSCKGGDKEENTTQRVARAGGKNLLVNLHVHDILPLQIVNCQFREPLQTGLPQIPNSFNQIECVIQDIANHIVQIQRQPAAFGMHLVVMPVGARPLPMLRPLVTRSIIQIIDMQTNSLLELFKLDVPVLNLWVRVAKGLESSDCICRVEFAVVAVERCQC